MAIDIGDAVLTLSAPTTQLEQDLDKIPGIVQGKLAPAGTQVDSLGKKFGDVGTAATGSANQIAAAGDKASGSMRATTEATRTVEEAIGVRLPRGVNNFLASLLQIPQAMEVAFAVTAIGFLAVGVGELTEKAVGFIAQMVYMSDSAKKVDAETAKLNADLITLNQQLEDSRLAFANVGASASEKAANAVDHLNDVFKKTQDEIDGLKNQLASARDSLQKSEDFQNSGVFKFLSFVTSGEKQGLAQQFFAGLTVSVGKFFGVLKDTDGIQKVGDAIAKVGQASQALTDGEAKGQKERVDAAHEASDANNKSAEQIQTQAKQTLDVQKASIAAWLAVQDAAYQKGTISTKQWSEDQESAIDRTSRAEIAYYDLLVKTATDRDQLSAAIEQRAQYFLDGTAKAAQEVADGYVKLNEQLRSLKELDDKLDQANQTNQLKSLSKATLDYVSSLKELADAQQQAKQGNFAAQEAQIQQLADMQVISETDKSARLRVLYQQEEDDALSALNDTSKKQVAAVQAAQAALLAAQTSGNVKAVAEAKASLNEQLAAQQLTDTQILQIKTQFNSKYAQLDSQLIRTAESSWDGFFKQLSAGALKSGQAIQALGHLTAQGIGESVEAAVNGSESFGQAMEGMLKSALASLAGQAVVQAITDVAKAYDCYAAAAAAAADPFTAPFAALWTNAGNAYLVGAAKWGVIGAAAAVGGAAIPSGGSGSSSGGGGGSSSSAGPSSPVSQATQAQPTPVQRTNAQGEINNPGASGTVINLHMNVQGVISSDNLTKVVKKISKAVTNRQVNLTSSNAIKLTKR